MILAIIKTAILIIGSIGFGFYLLERDSWTLKKYKR